MYASRAVSQVSAPIATEINVIRESVVDHQ